MTSNSVVFVSVISTENAVVDSCHVIGYNLDPDLTRIREHNILQ